MDVLERNFCCTSLYKSYLKIIIRKFSEIYGGILKTRGETRELFDDAGIKNMRKRETKNVNNRRRAAEAVVLESLFLMLRSLFVMFYLCDYILIINKVLRICFVDIKQ